MLCSYTSLQFPRHNKVTSDHEEISFLTGNNLQEFQIMDNQYSDIPNYRFSVQESKGNPCCSCCFGGIEYAASVQENSCMHTISPVFFFAGYTFQILF